MSTTAKLAALVLCIATLPGCISTKFYVDPQYHQTSYNDLHRLAPPYVLAVTVEFQRNGQPKPSVDAAIRADIERSLRASGVVLPYDGTRPADGQISFVLNNIADMGAAAAKGFGTGLTFGLAGSHVMDGYEMTVRVTQGASVTERKYQHAIHETVGVASAPAGMHAVDAGTAVNQVIDELVLTCLKDLQAAGVLRPQAPVQPVAAKPELAT